MNRSGGRLLLLLLWLLWLPARGRVQHMVLNDRQEGEAVR